MSTESPQGPVNLKPLEWLMKGIACGECELEIEFYPIVWEADSWYHRECAIRRRIVERITGNGFW